MHTANHHSMEKGIVDKGCILMQALWLLWLEKGMSQDETILSNEEIWPTYPYL